jgi:hypothetical protein
MQQIRTQELATSRPELVAEQNITTGFSVKVFREYMYYLAYDPSPPPMEFNECEKQHLSDIRKQCGGFTWNELIQEIKQLIIAAATPISDASPDEIVRRRISRLDAIENTYQLVGKTYKMIHKHNPKLMIVIYNRAVFLLNEANGLMTNISFEPTMAEMIRVKNTLQIFIDGLHEYWMTEHPRFIFTLPIELALPILNEQVENIMRYPSCLEMVMGARPISSWIDPTIAIWINFQRQKYIVEKKTNVLNICFGVAGIPVEICSLIASFIQATPEKLVEPLSLATMIDLRQMDGRVEMTFQNDGSLSHNIYITA